MSLPEQVIHITKWHAAACPYCHTVATQQAFATNIWILLRSFVMPKLLPDVQRMQMQLLAYCCFATNAWMTLWDAFSMMQTFVACREYRCKP